MSDTRSGWYRHVICALVALALCAVCAGAARAGTPAFVAADDLLDGRWAHVGHVLPDGRVFVAGGWGPLGGGFITIKSSAEVYDPSQGAWETMGSMTAPRASAVSAALADGRIVIAGGESVSPFGGLTTLRSIEIFDPAAASFTAAAELAFVPRLGAALSGDRVLFIGGRSEVAVFDAGDGTVTAAAPMAFDHLGGSATRLQDGSVLVAGGFTRTAEIFDPTTGEFQQAGEMVVDRTRGTATLLEDGRVAFAGGHGGFTVDGFTRALDSVEVFDPATGSSSEAGHLRATRLDHSATLLADGRILVVGGAFFAGGGTRDDAELFDLASGLSSVEIPTRQPRRAHTALALGDGSVLVVGGTESPTTSERFVADFTDTTPPELHLPEDITVGAASAEGQVASYTVSAADDSDPAPVVTCDPPSGSLFPIGTTVVDCTAIDAAGNRATGSFNVVVLPPLEIGLVVRDARVVPQTADITVGGQVSCNRPTDVFVGGTIRQSVAGRATIEASFGIVVSCTGSSTPWEATATAANGRFVPGRANVTVGGGGCDLYGCDFVETTATVVVRGTR